MTGTVLVIAATESFGRQQSTSWPSAGLPTGRPTSRNFLTECKTVMNLTCTSWSLCRRVRSEVLH